VASNKNTSYAIPSRLLSAAGNSIIQNAAVNEPFLQNWSLDYGFFRFDYNPKSEKKIKVRLVPLSIISTAMSFPNNKLDLTTTLCSGIMTFKSNDSIKTVHGKHDGINYGRGFVYYDDSLKYHIISHETIHEYQYREYQVINSFLKPSVAKIKDKGAKKWASKYIYPDIPYFGLFYMIEGVYPGWEYFRNYFELEAERSASNKYVPVK
jgi:hypothetical protein